jgi:hypothetical protein
MAPISRAWANMAPLGMGLWRTQLNQAQIVVARLGLLGLLRTRARFMFDLAAEEVALQRRHYHQ